MERIVEKNPGPAAVNRARGGHPRKKNIPFRHKHQDEVDLSQAERYLNILDEEADRFTFQTFDDSPKKRPHLARILHGRVHDVAPELQTLNAQGAGIFVTVNETDFKGRSSKNMTRVRAVFQEDDDKSAAPLPTPPHMVVQSSPGKYHRYILTDTTNLDEFGPVMQRMVNDYGSDPAAKDLPRVLRLPGFYHKKDPQNPHMVRIIEESGEQPYSWDEVKKHFPPVEKTASKQSSQSTSLAPVERGQRNDRLAQIAGRYANKGFELEEILNISLGWNSKLPEPLSRSEVETTVGSIWKKDRSTKAYNNQSEILKPVTATTAIDFLSMAFPPRENLLSPWLPMQGIAMIHAYRGVGKTHVSLGVACAVATGSSFLGWGATKPAGVLFIDGEMPGSVLQERISYTIAGMDGDGEAPFLIITPDLQEYGMPDLSTIEGQQGIEPYISDDIKLIVVDNISTLCRTGQENKGDTWLPVQEWALHMRARGKTVLLVHHDGKGGQQRGTSRKEDVLDTVIQLRHPADYTPDNGALFEVHFRKNRGIFGDDVKPFEAQLEVSSNGSTWVTRTLEDSLKSKVKRLFDDGYQQKDIAGELGISKGYVSKLAKQIKGEMP